MIKLSTIVKELVASKCPPCVICRTLEQELSQVSLPFHPFYRSLLLSAAVYECHLSLLHHLLVNGCDPNVRHGAYWPLPLHIALQERRGADYVSLLLNRGADVHIMASCSTEPPFTPRLAVVIPMVEDDVEGLVALVPYYNYQNTQARQSLLHLACIHGADKCIQYLLQSGHDVNVTDARDCTPLMSAVQHGPRVVQLLLQRPELDTDYQSNITHSSALHTSITLHNHLVPLHLTRLVKMLLDAKASIVQDNNGDTVVSLVMSQIQKQAHYTPWEQNLIGHSQVVMETLQLLLQHGASPDDGRCPAVCAVSHAVMMGTKALVAITSKHLHETAYRVTSSLKLANDVLLLSIKYGSDINAGRGNGVSKQLYLGAAIFESLKKLYTHLCYQEDQTWYGDLMHGYGALLQTFLNHGGIITDKCASAMGELSILSSSSHNKFLSLVWQTWHEPVFHKQIKQFNDNRKLQSSSQIYPSDPWTERCSPVHNNEQLVLNDDLITKYTRNPRCLTEIVRSAIFHLLPSSPVKAVKQLPGPHTLTNLILCSMFVQRY